MDEFFPETYDARGNPSVRFGKISEEEGYADFIDAFELHMATFVRFLGFFILLFFKYL